MRLDLKKLGKFDLEKDLENKLLTDENREQLINFLKTVNEIHTVDRFIRDCPSYPGSTDKIIKDELVSAVGGTLAIEGTMLKEEEIEESFQRADLQKKLKSKEQEAQNSRRTYQYIIELVDGYDGRFSYSEEHIKQINHYLTENVECVSPNVPGQYRDAKATFGRPTKISFCGRRADIEAIMPKFINWLNKEDSGLLSNNDIVKAIMAHYYLTEIHPFGDGNGRTARALEALILYVNGINTYCFWSLANFWSAHRDDYLVHLGNIRATCNPWDFLMWGTQGYLHEVERIKGAVLKKVKQLMLQDYVRWLFFKKKIQPRVFRILMLLIHVGKMPFNEFLSSPEFMVLYPPRKLRTRYRDFEKIEKEFGLIRVFKENGKKFIEPNFHKLEDLEYVV